MKLGIIMSDEAIPLPSINNSNMAAVRPCQVDSTTENRTFKFCGTKSSKNIKMLSLFFWYNVKQQEESHTKYKFILQLIAMTHIPLGQGM